MYLIFDRYRDYSLKGQTRLETLGQYARAHTLTMDTSVPTRETSLKAPRAKVPMIILNTRALLDHYTSIKCQNTLIVTCRDSIPIQSVVLKFCKEIWKLHMRKQMLLYLNRFIQQRSQGKSRISKLYVMTQTSSCCYFNICHPEMDG